VKHLQETSAPAVSRALDLLEILGRSSKGMTLSELSRRLEIPKSTTHYLIHTLTARGYMQRIPLTRQYSLGLRAFDIKFDNAREWHLRDFFSPRIREVAETTSLGAQIAVRNGDEGKVIDRFDCRPVPSTTRPGHHFRLHCTAAGKALIAWLSEPELERLFPNRFLAKFTTKTIADFEGLKVGLAEIRKKHYSVNDEEYHLDRRAVAAPIFDSDGQVIASLSVDGSTSEMPTHRFPKLAAELLAVAEEISREIIAN
jgi:DNA-binding IclR family transcriptional regulator